MEVNMNRRSSIRLAMLTGVGMALGKLDALKAQGGQLLVDLAQWDHVVFTLGKRKVIVSVEEVFNALSKE
jgi:hypothetical protein